MHSCYGLEGIGTHCRQTLRGAHALALLLMLVLFVGGKAYAVPSFARQTGMPCAQCHTMAFGPTLNSYGRQFKLNGYTFGEADSPFPPLALMALGGVSHTATDQPTPPVEHYSVNNNLSLDQISAFYGGRITSNTGAFVQVTYSGEDHKTTWDNLDVRHSQTLTIKGTSVVVGVSLNNNPTVQDLWNSTQAWGFPYIGSALVPTPTASPLIDGLGQTVLGATLYAMAADHLYLEAGAYRGLSERWLKNFGLSADDDPHINGLAPYWRAVLQFDQREHYYSVGLFGLQAKLQPDPTLPGTDRYTDLGADATYQFVDGTKQTLTLYLTYVREHQQLDASFAEGGSDSPSNNLHNIQASGTYTIDQTWSGSLGLFDTLGTRNTVLYSAQQLSGSASSSPNSSGYILQAEWVPFGKLHSFAGPWLNVRLGLQYTAYRKFSGGISNYDGFGRNASDNNSLFGFFWLAL